MFAYNPTPDRSGEILGNAGTNAAQIRAQGSVAAAQAVSDAITNISNMYMKKQEQNKQDTAKLESSMATGQAMMNLSQQYGTEGERFRQSLSDALNQAGNNPDKIAGATAAHMTYFDNMMAKDKTKAQYDSALELARQKQALGYGSAGSNPSLGVEVAPGIDLGW